MFKVGDKVRLKHYAEYFAIIRAVNANHILGYYYKVDVYHKKQEDLARRGHLFDESEVCALLSEEQQSKKLVKDYFASLSSKLL